MKVVSHTLLRCSLLILTQILIDLLFATHQFLIFSSFILHIPLVLRASFLNGQSLQELGLSE